MSASKTEEFCHLPPPTKKAKKDETKSNLKIDCIPSQLIGKIASFLRQWDYINFSKTNKSIYLGCNSPNLIQELELCDIYDYSSINLSFYRSVKIFNFVLPRFAGLKFPSTGDIVLNQLHTLGISGGNIRYADNNLYDVDGFLTKVRKHINVDNISTLEIDSLGDADDDSNNGNKFDIKQFYKILSAFPNVVDLSMDYIRLSGVLDPEKIYPKLRRLRLHTLHPCSSIIPLVNHHCNHLSHLEISPSADVYLDDQKQHFTRMSFSNLESLSFYTHGGTCEIFDEILKTATNLQKIKMDFDGSYSYVGASDIKDAMVNCIKSCKYLKCLDLSIGQDFDGDFDREKVLSAVLEGIGRGFFETQKRKRKEMKIIIRFWSHDIEMLNGYIFNIANTVNWVQISTNNFMLMFCESSSYHKSEINQIITPNDIEKIQNVSSNIKVKAINDDDPMVVITNVGAI